MDQETMRTARARYFAENGFGDDGGYGSPWVDFKLGSIPFPFPNTKARVRAVRFHDLHHILTGYRTDFRGELEISAWEIGAGCRDMIAAWQLNLGGLWAGAMLMPRRTFRAFVRGRRTTSLYDKDLDALLDGTVAEARRLCAFPEVEEHRPTALDHALFALAVLVGWIVGTLTFALVLLVVPPYFLWWLGFGPTKAGAASTK
ncbi:MAG: hypothetical protein IPJ34_12030 [Myxococcales bacterium]|nr:hypothetical protein [Myxococcales bacterium]